MAKKSIFRDNFLKMMPEFHEIHADFIKLKNGLAATNIDQIINPSNIRYKNVLEKVLFYKTFQIFDFLLKEK